MKDTGAGIDPNYSRNRTGLGLFISKDIIEAHGGKRAQDNPDGKGATFTFTLSISGEKFS